MGEGVAKTEKKIQDTLKEIDTSMNLMQEMSADVKEEMKRFHQVKCADFKRMMMAHVREQIDFHSKVGNVLTLRRALWSTFEGNILKTKRSPIRDIDPLMRPLK